MSESGAKGRFIEPMLLLRTESLPEGPDFSYELKFDGYRGLAIKTGGKVRLRSRNDNDFNTRYPGIAALMVADWMANRGFNPQRTSASNSLGATSGSASTP
jgi:hypothetical protein